MVGDLQGVRQQILANATLLYRAVSRPSSLPTTKPRPAKEPLAFQRGVHFEVTIDALFGTAQYHASLIVNPVSEPTTLLRGPGCASAEEALQALMRLTAHLLARSGKVPMVDEEDIREVKTDAGTAWVDEEALEMEEADFESLVI